MEYLQYMEKWFLKAWITECFKPCYKWTAFNTVYNPVVVSPVSNYVLKWNTFNTLDGTTHNTILVSFKPYYKWNAFNTERMTQETVNNINQF